jgi:Na+/serine symporter
MAWEDVGKRFAEITNRIFAKVLSARFLIAIMLAGTLCFCAIKVLELVAAQNLDKDSIAIRKEIFMYVMGAFTTACSSVVTLYFTRTDRWKNEDEDETPPIPKPIEKK